MRFLADECLDRRLAELARAGGHDVAFVSDLCRGGRDREVLAMALRQRRILLTEDKDFGELVMRAGAAAPGVVLFRDLGAAIDEIWGSLRALLERRGGGIERYLVVINGRRARLRPLAP